MSATDNHTPAPVLFEELSCSDNSVLGVATLNLPKALNALNLDMVRLLLARLQEWQQRPDVGAVLLKGAGEKAFCAGGDVVSLHNAMKANPDSVPDVAREFFCEEYQLDHAIHAFTKPFIVWGSGIVMGGGMGLLMGASHRIVTETSRMAMPEITIGLFPDVGGSYFLNKMPPGCGLFCGLTGAMINASDALELGLADHFMLSGQFDALVQQLRNIAWHNTGAAQTLNSYLAEIQASVADKIPASQFMLHREQIAQLDSCQSAQKAVEHILAMPASDDKWLTKAQKNLKAGSPITVHLVFEQLQRAGGLSLAEVLRMEYAMALNSTKFGEFQEGVRALLIDKDMQPQWQFAGPSQVPDSLIARFFEPQWQGEHPLSMLNDNPRQSQSEQESAQ